MSGKPIDEFLNECTEWHALIHGVWTGVKNIKWVHLPKGARGECEEEWHYFEAGQWMGWVLKIMLVVLGMKLGVDII